MSLCSRLVVRVACHSFLDSLGAVVYLTLLYGQLQDQGNKVAVNCLPLYSDQIDDR